MDTYHWEHIVEKQSTEIDKANVQTFFGCNPENIKSEMNDFFVYKLFYTLYCKYKTITITDIPDS